MPARNFVGDLVHLDVFGHHIVVLNTAQAAKDLLDGGSSIYSDRPILTMAELSGYGDEMGMLHYNDRWRTQRKIVAQSFNPGVVPRYYPIQEQEGRRLIQGMLRSPDTLISQTKTRIAAIIMRVTHGYTVKGADDPMLTMQLAAMDNFTSASDVGSWLVDFIPQLQHLPRWMPGASFLKLADEFKQLERRSVRTPYLWCKERIQEGTEDPGCLVATAIRQFEAKSNEQDEAELPWAASSGLGGGLDTVRHTISIMMRSSKPLYQNMSTIFTFILAMLHYPHVQTKAQAEIDGVVGNERLPSITDRPSLPYVRSVIAEVYRWYPAAPQAIPHALRQEDVYKGYLLPKSSIIIPNIWGMLHDPSAFPQPEKFEPERFGYSDGEMRKVTDLLFGFGRRSCPGSHFAEGSIFAVISTILATCNVVPKIDKHGNPIIPGIDYTSGMIIIPKNLECDIKPRSTRAQKLLEDYVSRSEQHSS
ncbi:hypothetical protein EVJ58_g6780 [Rhodofomes roseus]|uniref:Cytochrome P450 n=1 Tax=Rhodofomes roseus TaxID=34475 RepID=A0A4Y9Y7G8_9APHY|nr:hypothetical protein EVJ58_g6780 [Rhodofomes roseus]